MENPIPPPSRPSLSRRNLLMAGVAGVGVTTGFALGTALFRRRMSAVRADFTRTGEAIAALPEPNVEVLDPHEVVSEYQRTGADVLISFPYDTRFFPDRDLSRRIETYFGPMLQALPRYSTLHLIGPDHFPADAVTRLGGLPVQFYPCFNAEKGGMYVQDVGDALGTLTPEGQFRLVSPSSHRRWLREKEACGQPFEDARGWMVPGIDLWQPDPQYMDDVLAEKYPHRFTIQCVEAVFQGGNLLFGELPSGESCVFVSKTDFAFFLANILCQPYEDPCPESTYEAAKLRYARAFGTPHLIVVDEAQFKKDLQTKTLLEASRPHPFFHNDMIFFQHRVQGRLKAFISSATATAEALPEWTANATDDFLQRIQRQLADLGFDIVEIPFLTNDLNFINGIAYTDRDTGAPSLVLPFYHFDTSDPQELQGRYSDELNLNPYARACFEMAQSHYQKAGLVVHSAPYLAGNRTTLRHIVDGNSIRGGKNGGFHCRVQLLR